MFEEPEVGLSRATGLLLFCIAQFQLHLGPTLCRLLRVEQGVNGPSKYAMPG